MRNVKVVVVGLVILVALVSYAYFDRYSSTNAESLDEILLPLTMRIDREYVFSSIYLKCKVEDFSGKNIVDFIDDKNEIINDQFKDFFRDIQNNDEKAFIDKGLKWSKKPGNSEDRSNAEIASFAERNLSGTRALKNMYETKSSGFKVYSRLLIGDGGMVIWGTDKVDGVTGSFTHRRTIRYQDAAGEIRWDSAVEMPDVLQSAIVDSYQAAAEYPEKYQASVAKDNLKFDYEIEIPGEGTGNPAYLFFNGYMCGSVDIISQDVPGDDKILLFYQKAYRTWLNDSTEAFAEFFTDNIKNSIKSSIFSKDMGDELGEIALSFGRKVAFVLDAKPFYVLFYRTGKSTDLKIDLVVEDPVSGELKLAYWGGGSATIQYLASDSFCQVLNKISSAEFPLKK